MKVRRSVVVAAVAVTAGALLAAVPPVAHADAPACAWMDATESPDTRAAQLVGAMSLDDKIAMVHGAGSLYYGVAGHIPAIARLCVPDVLLNDAGAGVGDQQVNTTAFPAGIAQAASWDRALQQQYGQALGAEAWHKGIAVQLAPAVNIARTPLGGRNFEYAGEDPYLSGQTGAAEIEGIQSQHVIATVKHYAANNQETDRGTVSSVIDERTLHEIYLPAFETAVEQAHVGSVMCSYNKVNGTYACENGTLLTDILKDEFGFLGFVMSDWSATHSTVAAANNGLDLEMPADQYFGNALKTAVTSGAVMGWAGGAFSAAGPFLVQWSLLLATAVLALFLLGRVPGSRRSWVYLSGSIGCAVSVDSGRTDEHRQRHAEVEHV